ncbi:MAG: nucleotidyltransferase family protein [Clostridiaceae bacterium]
MTDSDKLFLTLLSKAIRGGSFDRIDSDADWGQIFELAKEHDVSALLYSAIEKSDIQLPDEIADKWKKHTMFSAIRQAKLYYDVEEAIKLLTDAGIEVIAVKGLYFRFLYPDPVLRSMADADILIHRKDFTDAVRILNGGGYINGTYNENVTSFVRKPFCHIELHTNLIFEHEFKYAATFIKPWENAVSDESISGYARILSLEDCFIYAVVHIAKHLNHKGHGVRQLCDLVLFVEKNMDRIDWINISNRLKEIELKNLTDILLSLCHKYLDMSVPPVWLYDNPDVEKISDVLIVFLLKCGVFGYREGKNTKVYELRQTKKNLVIKSNYLSTLIYILQQFFPPFIAMKGTYNYLKKYPFLLLFAWVSRIGKYIRNRRKYSMQIKEIVSSTKDIDGEAQLLNTLGLSEIFK